MYRALFETVIIFDVLKTGFFKDYSLFDKTLFGSFLLEQKAIVERLTHN